MTLTRAAITDALVTAFRQRVQVVVTHHRAHPGDAHAAGAHGAIRTEPCGITGEICVTLAIRILLTRAVARAAVLT